MTGNLLFLGDVLAKGMYPNGGSAPATACSLSEAAFSSLLTGDRQSLGEPHIDIGEGRGDISASGPTFGEETMEAGERESARWVLEE